MLGYSDDGCIVGSKVGDSAGTFNERDVGDIGKKYGTVEY